MELSSVATARRSAIWIVQTIVAVARHVRIGGARFAREPPTVAGLRIDQIQVGLEGHAAHEVDLVYNQLITGDAEAPTENRVAT